MNPDDPEQPKPPVNPDDPEQPKPPVNPDDPANPGKPVQPGKPDGSNGGGLPTTGDPTLMVTGGCAVAGALALAAAELKRRRK